MSSERVSEWMRIMLEEIARKKAEEDEMRVEEQRRREGPREVQQSEEPNARSI
jgi:hypothetical protein